MEILAKRKILVPHWHIPLVTAVCLISGLWVDSLMIVGIGIFFAGLQCSIFLPIWKEAANEKDKRFLAYVSETKFITFWYHAKNAFWVAIATMVISIIAIFFNLIAYQE